MLRVQIVRALRGLAVLVDGRQVDRLQPAHAAIDLVHRLFPVAQAGIIGQRVEHVLQHETGLFHRALQGFGAEHQRLLVELALRNALALGQRLLVTLVAGLFVIAQLGIDAIEQRARFGQHAVGAHTLFQRVLVFGLQ